MFFSRYRIFRWYCFAFLAGVALASTIPLDFFELYTLFLAAGAVIIFFRKNIQLRIAGFLFILLLVGAGRVLAVPVERFYDLPEGKFSFSGVVVSEPRLRGATQAIVLDIRAAPAGESHGLLGVRLPLIPEARIGDTVSGMCARALPVWNAPWGATYPPLCTWSESAITPSAHISFWRTFSDARTFFQDTIDRGLPSPPSDLLGGLLLGVHQTFSEELKEDFRRSGVSHIVAVSGYNVMIIVGGLWSIMRFSPLGRRRSFWILAVSIALFVCLTGAGAATVRAGVMGALVLFGTYLGRLSQSGHALLIAASVMVAIDPSLLISSVGFQLSVLATMGLIYISPIIAPAVHGIPNPLGMRDAGVQTLAAYGATAPLIAGTFHTFSFVAFPANLFIVPLVPLAMGIGFAWSVIELIDNALSLITPLSLSWLSGVAAVPVIGIANTIIGISSYFSSFSFAQVTLDEHTWIPQFIMIGGYIMLAAAVIFARRRLRFASQEGTMEEL